MKFLVHRQSEINDRRENFIMELFLKMSLLLRPPEQNTTARSVSFNWFAKCNKWLLFVTKEKRNHLLGKNKMKLSLWILWNFVTFPKYIKPVTVCTTINYTGRKISGICYDMRVNEKFLYSREPFKPLFCCVATKCKIFLSLACVKSGGKWITIHTRGSYFHCLSDWSGVGFILTMVTLFPPRLYIKTNNWKQFLKNLFNSCLFSKIDVSQYLLWV